MTTPDLNLPYFPPEDTSTRSLTDQLFKQQAVITELLEALGRIAGVMSGKGLSKAQLRNQLTFAISTAKREIRHAEEQA